jgi:hypothetical protein
MRTHSLLIALPVAALLALTACELESTDGADESESDTAANAYYDGIADHEAAYLDMLYEHAEANGSGIKSLGDEWNVDLGYAVCDDIASGMTPTDVVASIAKVDEGETVAPISKVASELVGSAQLHLCDNAE